MSMQAPIADMFTRIRNGLHAELASVSMPSSKLKVAIANVLKDEGFITEYQVEGEVKPTLLVQLKYFQGKPVISRIQGVSKPSQRVYKGVKNLPTVLGGLGIAIVSTPKGVMTDKKARAQGLGGEVLCVVE